MPRARPPYLHRERSRHGQLVWYVRRGAGPRIRLRAEYGTPDFWSEYRAALAGTAPGSKPAKAAPRSLRWLIDRYRQSSAWASLAAGTRAQRENVFRAVIKTAGDEPLSAITPAAILAGRERRKAHAANAFLKAMRGLFGWAAEAGLVAADPTAGVRRSKFTEGGGFHTWTPDELARFEAYWPIGTRQRLSFDLLLYTGLRRSDAVRVGRQHVRDGVIELRAEKTGETLYLPILAPLAASIEAAPTGDLTFLVTSAGRPWAKESFSAWFRSIAREAGCPGAAHGIRKAGAVRAAEAGATDRELMALFGWTSVRMASLYTRSADRKRLAGQAAPRLLGEQAGNEKRPHLRSGAGAKPKSKGKSGG